MNKQHTKNLLLFTKQISISLKSGMPLTESLEMVEDQAVGRMKKIINAVLTDVQIGNSLHESLAKFPDFFLSKFINIVKIGEVTGTLEESLNQLAEEIQKTYEIKKKVQGAMMYPIIVLIAVLGLGFSIALFVLPKIIPLFTIIKVDLPITTKLLIFVANLFKDHGLIITFATFSFIFGIFILLKQNFVKPYSHKLLLVIPGLKTIVTNINMVSFSNTFGTLLSIGVTIDESLKITSDSMDNRIYRRHIKKMIYDVRKGKSISAALQAQGKLFPKMVVKLIDAGEKTGNLEIVIDYIGQFYNKEVDSTLKNLSTIIEPILLIFIGLLVGGIAMSILSPIYEITGNL